MCATCGCADPAGVRLIDLDAHPHDHGHGPGHEHPHPHPHPDAGEHGSRDTITLEQRVLAKNDLLAERNRGWLDAHGVRAVNLMSSPGAGKTTLLVRTIHDLGDRTPIYVVEGDQETTFDAERIQAAGAPVLQVNTGSGCHLDASIVADALRALDPRAGGLVIVENVGNLVCPALFDLGEDRRAVVMSVTEGADKPRKYPHIFRTASVVLLNKIDLLPYVDFDVDRFRRDLALVNPAVAVVPLSATTGEGLSGWYDWLGAA
jgi:hydrogenase nickel incorporation protein HypB